MHYLIHIDDNKYGIVIFAFKGGTVHFVLICDIF